MDSEIRIVAWLSHLAMIAMICGVITGMMAIPPKTAQRPNNEMGLTATEERAQARHKAAVTVCWQAVVGVLLLMRRQEQAGYEKRGKKQAELKQDIFSVGFYVVCCAIGALLLYGWLLEGFPSGSSEY